MENFLINIYYFRYFFLNYYLRCRFSAIRESKKIYNCFVQSWKFVKWAIAFEFRDIRYKHIHVRMYVLLTEWASLSVQKTNGDATTHIGTSVNQSQTNERANLLWSNINQTVKLLLEQLICFLGVTVCVCYSIYCVKKKPWRIIVLYCYKWESNWKLDPTLLELNGKNEEDGKRMEIHSIFDIHLYWSVELFKN